MILHNLVCLAFLALALYAIRADRLRLAIYLYITILVTALSLLFRTLP